MKLFVYGTLQRGYGNHRLLAGAEFLGKAVTAAPYKMFNIGFPFILPGDDSDGYVEGELFEIDEQKHLPSVDRLEGEGTFYVRKSIPVYLEETNERLFASVYEMLNPYYAGNYSEAEVEPDEDGRLRWQRY
jgi:gamma-glutamylaminecyclotransferase